MAIMSKTEESSFIYFPLNKLEMFRQQYYMIILSYFAIQFE